MPLALKNMDNKFTEKIKAWLEASEEQRDYSAGNMMLLQLSGNRIMFDNFSRTPDRYREHVAYQLQKYYNFRVQELTHAEVTKMQATAEAIVEAAAADEQRKTGKRDDHDSLPPEIQQCYTDNFPILAEMREKHAELRKLSRFDDAPCPDSDKYPFLKEGVKQLIELDERRCANWKKYDEYGR